VPAVPHGDVVSHTREETTFCDTKTGTSGEETVVVVDYTHQCTANTPSDHDERDPEGWSCLLHHQVGGDLCENVEWEEDGEGNLSRISMILISNWIGSHLRCSRALSC